MQKPKHTQEDYMSYSHLTTEERACLHFYYNQGLSLRKISKLLGRSPSTVSREIRRNYWQIRKGIFWYYASAAQNKAERRKRYCHRGTFFGDEVLSYIEEKLALTWSPEQIANAPCKLKLPSTSTIYRLIYEGYIVKGNLKYLRRKGKSRQENKRGRVGKRGKSIRKRPNHVYNRHEFGHWELDTVVSGQGKSTACFVTFAERKTRYYIAVKSPDRKAETVKKVIIDTLSNLPQSAVKTITTDNGNEFAAWEDIEKALGCEVYFTDTYCAWQKGTNENLNGLLREFYPKGRNLSRVNYKTLQKNLALINARPKKVLHYKNPQDLFYSFLSKCCT